jgi:hypothetical protein
MVQAFNGYLKLEKVGLAISSSSAAPALKPNRVRKISSGPFNSMQS